MRAKGKSLEERLERARLALGKESQHLEKLGIVVPSTIK